MEPVDLELVCSRLEEVVEILKDISYPALLLPAVEDDKNSTPEKIRKSISLIMDSIDELGDPDRRRTVFIVYEPSITDCQPMRVFTSESRAQEIAEEEMADVEEVELEK